MKSKFIEWLLVQVINIVAFFGKNSKIYKHIEDESQYVKVDVKLLFFITTIKILFPKSWLYNDYSSKAIDLEPFSRCTLDSNQFYMPSPDNPNRFVHVRNPNIIGIYDDKKEPGCNITYFYDKGITFRITKLVDFKTSSIVTDANFKLAVFPADLYCINSKGKLYKINYFNINDIRMFEDVNVDIHLEVPLTSVSITPRASKYFISEYHLKSVLPLYKFNKEISTDFTESSIVELHNLLKYKNEKTDKLDI